MTAGKRYTVEAQIAAVERAARVTMGSMPVPKRGSAEYEADILQSVAATLRWCQANRAAIEAARAAVEAAP